MAALAEDDARVPQLDALPPRIERRDAILEPAAREGLRLAPFDWRSLKNSDRVNNGWTRLEKSTTFDPMEGDTSRIKCWRMHYTRMNRFFAILSLLIVSPTFLVLPYSLAVALGLPIHFVGFFILSPSELFQRYDGHATYGIALYYEFLVAFWVYGYFCMVIAYFILLLPHPKRLELWVWSASALYSIVILTLQPWERPIFGLAFDPGARNTAFDISVLMLLVSLSAVAVSVLASRSNRMAGQLPPPLPKP